MYLYFVLFLNAVQMQVPLDEDMYLYSVCCVMMMCWLSLAYFVLVVLGKTT